MTRIERTCGDPDTPVRRLWTPGNFTLDLTHDHDVAEDRHQRRKAHEDERAVERPGLLR
jgi:hypothetical protein